MQSFVTVTGNYLWQKRKQDSALCSDKNWGKIQKKIFVFATFQLLKKLLCKMREYLCCAVHKTNFSIRLVLFVAAGVAAHDVDV